MLISSVALNMVSLAVLKPDSLAPELVDRALAVGRALAWGPLVARTANAAAGVAHARGDGAAELALLNEAAGAAPTDTSLAARLAELRLAQGDRAGAIRAWQTNHLLIRVPLEHGASTTNPAVALDWFGVAQAVDPTDPRPYAEAARVLLAAGQPARAAPYLAQALKLGRSGPSLSVIARRLLDPFASLDPEVPPATPVEVGQFWQASQVFTARGDLIGAKYALEQALRVDPANLVFQSTLAGIRRTLGLAS